MAGEFVVLGFVLFVVVFLAIGWAIQPYGRRKKTRAWPEYISPHEYLEGGYQELISNDVLRVTYHRDHVVYVEPCGGMFHTVLLDENPHGDGRIRLWPVSCGDRCFSVTVLQPEWKYPPVPLPADKPGHTSVKMFADLPYAPYIEYGTARPPIKRPKPYESDRR